MRTRTSKHGCADDWGLPRYQRCDSPFYVSVSAVARAFLPIFCLPEWNKTGTMSVMEVSGGGLEAQVARFMRDHSLVVAGETVLVAVSGGADSVALLFLFIALREMLGITIIAAHFEHGIRGEPSREDAQFVKALCAEQGIACQLGAGDVPALARTWHCSMEDAARRARYAFLENTAFTVGAAKIALAHQMEDQAETLLLHLIHGAGLRGLSGMRPIQGNRIRPLLDVPRATLEAYLTAQAIPWREDATNTDTSYTRNFLRHEVFPLLRRLNPRAAEAMARTASLAAQAVSSLDIQAEEALAGRVKSMPYGMFWDVPERGVTPGAVRLLAEWAGLPPMDARHTQALVSLAPGEKAGLPGAWQGLRTRRRLHLIKANQPSVVVAQDDFQYTPTSGLSYGDGIRAQVFDADKLEGAVFRLRQVSDMFAPIGMLGTQKLKKTLQDAGIDRPFRDLLPVLAIGSRVLWIVGLKAGRDAAVGPDTKRMVRIEYHGELPWEIDGGDGHDRPEQLGDVQGLGGDTAHKGANHRAD